jgi:hypothetical protein
VSSGPEAVLAGQELLARWQDAGDLAANFEISLAERLNDMSALQQLLDSHASLQSSLTAAREQFSHVSAKLADANREIKESRSRVAALDGELKKARAHKPASTLRRGGPGVGGNGAAAAIDSVTAAAAASSAMAASSVPSLSVESASDGFNFALDSECLFLSLHPSIIALIPACHPVLFLSNFLRHRGIIRKEDADVMGVSPEAPPAAADSATEVRGTQLWRIRFVCAAAAQKALTAWNHVGEDVKRALPLRVHGAAGVVGGAAMERSQSSSGLISQSQRWSSTAAAQVLRPRPESAAPPASSAPRRADSQESDSVQVIGVHLPAAAPLSSKCEEFVGVAGFGAVSEGSLAFASPRRRLFSGNRVVISMPRAVPHECHDDEKPIRERRGGGGFSL